MNTAVRNAGGSPLATAAVEFRDKNGSVAFTGVTNAAGNIDNVVLMEYRNIGNGQAGTSAKTFWSPYTVTITPAGGSPVASQFALDGKKTVNFQVGGTISVAPNAN